MVIGGIVATAAVKALMHISFYLDVIVYRIAGWSFKIFYVMGSITLDADETVQIIVNKIYTILLIFMVFVVAYNMLLYIIEPDKIKHTDKTPGAADLVRRIAISLIVIVAFPLFFDVLYDVQRDIIEYNVIGTIILGGASDSSDMDGTETCVVSGVGDSGDALVADVYSAFLYPVNGIEPNDCCNGSVSQEEIDADTPIGNYCTAYLEARDRGGIMPFSGIKDAAIKDDTDYQYLGIVSTAAGVFMAIYFLGFCINLGIRLFKLLALELVAPIPALMDLVPGKSGTLSTWFQEVLKVYAEVFIYQAIVFSLVWLATLIPGLLTQVSDSIENTAADAGASSGFILLAKVLMIMALFQGAKEIPTMLSKVLKIEGAGGLLKTVGQRGINMFSGAGALAFGAASNFAKSYKGSGGNLLSASAGALGSLRRNVWGMRNAKNFKDIKASTKASTEATQNKRIKRSAYYQGHNGGEKGFKGAMNVAKARGQDAIGAVAGFASDNFALQTEFSKKRDKEKAAEEVKKIYAEGFGDKLKADEQYAKADSDVKTYENIIKAHVDQIDKNKFKRSDGSFDKAAYDAAVKQATKFKRAQVDKETGKTIGELLDEAKRRKTSAEETFTEKHAEDLMKTFEKLKNAGYANAEIKKYVDQKLSGLTLDQAVDAAGKGQMAFAEKLKQTDKAAKDELTQLNADIDYKKQKIAQESKKDAKEQIDKATKEATEKKDN